ncbi:MAG: competence/damage-inducible protein A [Planctomycetota bacterium]|jgi:nicotinamide-nucleotide amidase|nr:competence/damage-inducible protein A [Planctomycetota bacterium]
MTQPAAFILSCGDELLFGHTIDTNAAWLAGECTGLGWRVVGHVTVGDVLQDIVAALREASRTADVVIMTGGLGPTEDDRTRYAIAEALGVHLAEDSDAIREIEAVFRRCRRPMRDVNRVQALIPEGAVRIANPNGTAPGIRAVLGNATIYAMPGVPREMREMFQRTVKPEMQGKNGDRREVLRRLRLFGMGESEISEAIRHLMHERDNPEVGTTVAEGVITVRIYARGDTIGGATAIADSAEREIRRILGDTVFGTDGETPASAAVKLLKEKHAFLCTAESCTGGMIAANVVDVPGASAVFMEGTVTYSNESKIAKLGVDPAIIGRFGAVSRETVVAMAEGALKNAGFASRPAYSLAVTGIAGPDGGTPEKPAGTIWIGCASLDEKGSGATRTMLANVVADRCGVRLYASHAALDLLRRTIAGLPFAKPVETTEWRVG